MNGDRKFVFAGIPCVSLFRFLCLQCGGCGGGCIMEKEEDVGEGTCKINVQEIGITVLGLKGVRVLELFSSFNWRVDGGYMCTWSF